MMNKYIKKMIIICIVLLVGINTSCFCEVIETNPLIDIYKKLDDAQIAVIKNATIPNEEKEWVSMIDDTIASVIPRHKFKMSYFDENDNYVEYKKTYKKNEDKIKKPDRNCLFLDYLIGFLYTNYIDKMVESDNEYGEAYLYEKMLLKDFIDSIDNTKLNQFFDPNNGHSVGWHGISKYIESYYRLFSFIPHDYMGNDAAYYIEVGYEGGFPTDSELKKEYKENMSLIKKLFEPLDFETYKSLEPLFDIVKWLFKYDYGKTATEPDAIKYLIEAYNYIKEDNKFYDVK